MSIIKRYIFGRTNRYFFLIFVFNCWPFFGQIYVFEGSKVPFDPFRWIKLGIILKKCSPALSKHKNYNTKGIHEKNPPFKKNKVLFEKSPPVNGNILFRFNKLRQTNILRQIVGDSILSCSYMKTDSF